MHAAHVDCAFVARGVSTRFGMVSVCLTDNFWATCLASRFRWCMDFLAPPAAAQHAGT